MQYRHIANESQRLPGLRTDCIRPAVSLSFSMGSPVRHIIVLLAAALLLASCGRQAGGRVLDERQFATLYVQLTRAGVSVRDMASDSATARRKADEVLRRAGVSRRDVETTVRWYNEDVTRWRGFFDDVMKIAADSLAR